MSMSPTLRGLLHRFPSSSHASLLLRKPLLTSTRRRTQSQSQSRPLSFSRSLPRSYPRKNAQDREAIDTEATEYSKSGTDDAAAKQEEAAFDPEQTSPEQEKDTAGQGTGVSSCLFKELSFFLSFFLCFLWCVWSCRFWKKCDCLMYV